MSVSAATELARLKFTPTSDAYRHMQRFERLVEVAYPHVTDSDKWSLFVKTIDTNNNPAWNNVPRGGLTPSQWLMELNEQWQRDNPPCEDPDCHDCRNDAMSFDHLRNAFLGKWGGAPAPEDRRSEHAPPPAPGPPRQHHGHHGHPAHRGPPSRAYPNPPGSFDSSSETESTVHNQHALVPHAHARSSVHMPPSAPTPPNEKVEPERHDTSDSESDDDGVAQETKTSISINTENNGNNMTISISDNKAVKKKPTKKTKSQAQKEAAEAAEAAAQQKRLAQGDTSSAYNSRPGSPAGHHGDAAPEPHLELYKPGTPGRPTPPPDMMHHHRTASGRLPPGVDPRDPRYRDLRSPHNPHSPYAPPDPRNPHDPRNAHDPRNPHDPRNHRGPPPGADPRDYPPTDDSYDGYDDHALTHSPESPFPHDLTRTGPPRSATSTPPPPPLRPRLLEGKIAAITGANRGIGRALALGFAREGAHIVAHYWGTKSDPANEEIVQLCVDIRSLNQGCTIVFGDMADQRTSESIVRRAVEVYGRLDIAVGNAGMCWFRDFLDVTPELLRRHIEVNLNGNFYFVQAAAKQFKRQWHDLQEEEDGGSQDCSIMCVAGSNGGEGDRAAHFSACAAGVRELMKCCAQGLARYGVRCNTLSPGIVQTKMVRDIVEDQETRARMEKRSPFGRLGVPGDVVGPAVWLAGDMGRWVNGQEIIIDGGSSVV